MTFGGPTVFDDIILNNINQKVATMLHSNKSYSGYLKKVQDRKIDPFEAADKISNSIMKWLYGKGESKI